MTNFEGQHFEVRLKGNDSMHTTVTDLTVGLYFDANLHLVIYFVSYTP